MSKNFKKFLTESEIKLDPNMRVGDTLRLNINAKDVVEMRITALENNKIVVESEEGSSSHISQYKHKNVPGLYTFTHLEHPNGSFIQYNPNSIVHHNKKTGEQKRFDRKDIPGLLDHLKSVHADESIDEAGKKPDYLDFDKDGDKDESMKKALKDKGEDVEEGQIDEILKLSGVEPVKPGLQPDGSYITHDEEAMEFDDYEADDEELNELSKNKLGQYVNKASNDAAMKAHQYGIDKERSDEIDRYTNRSGMKDQFKARDTMKKELGIDDMHKNWNKAGKRIKGINKAVSKLTREQVDQIEVTESNGNLFATILRNAGLKTVTESDLNNKTSEENQIDEISANLVSRAAKQADRNAYDADKAGAYKAQEIHKDQADRLYAKAKEKEEKEERESAKANELRGLSGVKTRALNKKFYNAEGASKKNTFELSEGKIVYMGETYDLTLDNNKRTWTANIWTTRKTR